MNRSKEAKIIIEFDNEKIELNCVDVSIEIFTPKNSICMPDIKVPSQHIKECKITGTLKLPQGTGIDI